MDGLSSNPRSDPRRISRERAASLSEADYARLAGLFHVLADPSRARIVCLLLGGDLCTRDLAEITRISEPAVSQHLRLLRELRLVQTNRAGRRVYYSLDDEHVAQLLDVSLQHIAHASPAERHLSHSDESDSSDGTAGAVVRTAERRSTVETQGASEGTQ